MFKSKDQTEPTLPLSSAENTAESVPPLSQSAKTEATKTSTPTTKQTSRLTLPAKLTEKIRQHAMIWRVALLQLERAGLLRRFKIYENDVLKEYRIVLSPSIWTDGLEIIESVVESESVVDTVVNPDNTHRNVP